MRPKFSSEVDLEEGSRDKHFVKKMTMNRALHKFKIFDIRGSSDVLKPCAANGSFKEDAFNSSDMTDTILKSHNQPKGQKSHAS